MSTQSVRDWSVPAPEHGPTTHPQAAPAAAAAGSGVVSANSQAMPTADSQALPIASLAVGSLALVLLIVTLILLSRMAARLKRLYQRFDKFEKSQLEQPNAFGSTVGELVRKSHEELFFRLIPAIQKTAGPTAAGVRGDPNVSGAAAGQSQTPKPRPRAAQETRAPSPAVPGFDPQDDDVMARFDQGSDRTQSHERTPSQVSAPLNRPPPLPPIGIPQLLAEIQKIAEQVLAEGGAADIEKLTAAINSRATEPVQLQIRQARLRVCAHNSSSDLVRDFHNPDFLSVTRPDGEGWLIPSPRVRYSQSFRRFYEGDATQWPDFTRAAQCTVDSSGHASLSEKGQL